MFPLHLQYLLIDLRQTLVTGASWDTDDLITFLGQKVKVQGHTIAVEVHSTQHSTLPSSATFSSLTSWSNPNKYSPSNTNNNNISLLLLLVLPVLFISVVYYLLFKPLLLSDLQIF